MTTAPAPAHQGGSPQALAQQQAAQNRQVIASIAALFLLLGLGTSVAVLLGDIRALLLKLRPARSSRAIEAVLQIISPGMPEPNLPSDFTKGPAWQAETEASAAWRALYVVAAVDRLSAAPDFAAALEREAGYFATHIDAEERRLRSAALVDVAAELMEDRETEGLLGWRAVIDGRTTPECRDAHGRNFRADRMPLIGWPGAVHMRCRCSAGPPIPGAPLLRSV